MHVMLDLETLGTRPNAPVVAIGACRFTRTEVLTGVQNTFYATIDLESAVRDSEASIDATTVKWWLNQEAAPRAQIANASRQIHEILISFRYWIDGISDLEGIWGCGAAFDNVILAETYRRAKLPVPWKFWQDRCYRTIREENPSVKEDARTGTHHNALDDAIHQAKHLVKIWNI